MSCHESISQMRNRFSHGSFCFSNLSPALKTVVKDAKVPVGYGVYVIYGILKDNEPKGNEQLIYIGKSETVINNGSAKAQKITGRICNVRETLNNRKIFGNEYFRDVIAGKKGVGPFVKLRFELIETYPQSGGVPPFLAEAQLLGAYLAECGRLPPLNKSA